MEVGAQGMDALISVLVMDRTDNEIVAYALESLLNITQPEPLEDEDPNMPPMGKQFTEILTKKTENVQSLLSVLDEYDFRVRLPAIKLMTNLLRNRPKEIQETLLVSPMGISKIVDLLSDSREPVRNEVSFYNFMVLCRMYCYISHRVISSAFETCRGHPFEFF